jgi:hypothetical protein
MDFWHKLPFELKELIFGHLPLKLCIHAVSENRSTSLSQSRAAWAGKSYVPNTWCEVKEFVTICQQHASSAILISGIDFSQLVDPHDHEDIVIFTNLLATRLCNIRALSLSKFKATRLFFRMLLKNRFWWRTEKSCLTELDVSYNGGFDSAVLHTLISDFSFQGLKILNISYCTELSDQELAALSYSVLAPKLSSLYLDGCRFSTASLIHYLPKFSALKHLSIADYSNLIFEDVLHLLTVCRFSIHCVNNPHFKRDFCSVKCSTCSSYSCCCLIESLQILDLSYNDSFTLDELSELERVACEVFQRQLKVAHRTCVLKNHEPQSLLQYLLQYCQ